MAVVLYELQNLGGSHEARIMRPTWTKLGRISWGQHQSLLIILIDRSLVCQYLWSGRPMMKKEENLYTPELCTRGTIFASGVRVNSGVNLCLRKDGFGQERGRSLEKNLIPAEYVDMHYNITHSSSPHPEGKVRVRYLVNWSSTWWNKSTDVSLVNQIKGW